MKRDGILNEHINLIISRLGHTDLLAISDCGLPIPDGVLRVDISLVKGIPSFKEVVKAISEELVIERAFIAQEMRQRNTGCYDSLLGLLPGIEIVELPHEELKKNASQGQGGHQDGRSDTLCQCDSRVGGEFLAWRTPCWWR
jgi:D-ribose pyranase